MLATDSQSRSSAPAQSTHLHQLYITHCLYDEGLLRQAGFAPRASSTRDPLLLRFAQEYPSFELPAGVTVTPCIHLVHRDPAIYPEPERFLPERFLETPPGTYTWIPFGGGIRRCLGAALAMAEMRVVLTTMARRLYLEADRPEPERAHHRNVTMIPARGGRVVVRARRD